MVDLSGFAITRRWPARYRSHPALFAAHAEWGEGVDHAGRDRVALRTAPGRLQHQRPGSPEFTSLNPYNKIPAIIDPNGPEGAPLPLFESGAILLYLAEKSGALLPRARAARYQCLQWVFFQVGGIGPMFGQLGFFTNSQGGTGKTNVH
jgi:GST-like protein